MKCVCVCVCVCARVRVCTSEDGWLLFGRADKTTDALDHLTLGVHLLLTRLLAQEDSGDCRDEG